MAFSRSSLGFRKPSSFRLFLLQTTFMLLLACVNLYMYSFHWNMYFRKIYAHGTEYKWMQVPWNKALMVTHLACAFPCAVLSIMQFVPRLQLRKYSTFHRLNGYLVLGLSVPAAITGLMMSTVGLGGELSHITSIVALAVATIVPAFQGWRAAKRLQFDEHRRMMLRAFVCMGSIVTLRPIGVIVMFFLSNFYNAIPCDVLDDLFTIIPDRSLVAEYPVCANLTNTALVRAEVANIEGRAAAFRLSFGSIMWMALVLHAAAVEIYITKTLERSQQLKLLSEQRQKQEQKLAGAVPKTKETAVQ